MGGKGSGGHRAGAGRKPQNDELGAVKGSRRSRARAKAKATAHAPNQTTSADAPATPPLPPDVKIPEPPGNLTLDELAVWNELAPLAEREGTLSESTAIALRDLCESMVLKRKLLRRIGDDGLVVVGTDGSDRAHPLLTQFRGLMQRVEAGMIRFKLSPMGKELGPPPEKKGAAVVDAFAEFDEPVTKPARPH